MEPEVKFQYGESLYLDNNLGCEYKYIGTSNGRHVIELEYRLYEVSGDRLSRRSIHEDNYNELVEAQIHSEEANVGELLAILRLMRLHKEDFIKRSDRAQEEINQQIDACQKNIKNLKEKL